MAKAGSYPTHCDGHFRVQGASSSHRRTWSVDISNAVGLTGTSVPTSARVRSGVATTASRVDTVVIATLKGTSAFARNVTTFEATPPGQLATMQILQVPCQPYLH